MTHPCTIDIFCTVIDNYGDAGVCWRLAEQLAQHSRRVAHVRLWTDSPDLITRLCPTPPANISVQHWNNQSDTLETDLHAGEMVIEAFGCRFDHHFVARRLQAGLPPPAWINLEYLSAEDWVENCHGLPSPISHGVCSGLQKTFVFPGFTERTGGLLLEPNLSQRMAHFDRTAWLQQLNPAVAWHRHHIVSLFCYPHAPVQLLLDELTAYSTQQPVALLVCAGHPTRLVQSLPTQTRGSGANGRLHIEYLPFISQTAFDHLLWASDFNCVRGEDSIVRAVAAGKPLLWHIYPQEDGAHIAKLNAFADRLGLSAAHPYLQLWNGIDNAAKTTQTDNRTRHQSPAPPFRLLHQHTAAADTVQNLLQRSLVSHLLEYLPDGARHAPELPTADSNSSAATSRKQTSRKR